MQGVYLPFLLFLVLATSAAGWELSGQLEEVRIETCHRLGVLYRLEQRQLLEPIDITIANPGEEEYQQWSGIPEFAAGAAHGPSGRIIIVPERTGEYPFGDEAQTLRHELSHILLYRTLGYRPPRWLDEGLAMRAAGEWGVRDEWQMIFALPDAAKGDYPLGHLERDFQQGESKVRRSYALARAFVGDLFRDDRELSEFIASARQAGSVERAFNEQYETTPEEAFQKWAHERPVWREWAVVLGSSRVTWGIALLVFLMATIMAFLRRRLSYSRLPE